MYEHIFKAMLITSCTGSIFATVLMLCSAVTKDKFSSGWRYYMWIAVLLIMLIPIRLEIPQTGVMQSVQMPVSIRQLPPVMLTDIDTVPQAKRSGFEVTAIIWLCVAVGLFIIKLGGFCNFINRIKRNSEKIVCGEISGFTKRKIKVYKSKEILSPFMTGMLLPTLFLPDTELTQIQMNNVLAHEMMHFRRGDICIKWISAVVKCIHWFNPFVYLICGQINTLCEISCDLQVTQDMSSNEKAEYVSTILSLVRNKAKNAPFTTAMVSGKKKLFQRFMHIKSEKRMTGLQKISAVVISFVLIVTVVLTGGILSGSMNVSYKSRFPTISLVLPDVKELFPSERKRPPIEKKEEIPQVTKPEEISQTSEVIPKPEETPIEEKQEEEVLLAAPEEAEPTVEYEPEEYIGTMAYDEATKAMNAEEIIKISGNKPQHSGADAVNLETHYKSFAYNFDNETTITAEVYPDKHGNISIYFDSEVSGINASVNISKKEMNGRGWGYTVPTDNKRAYYFCNFDPDTAYDITISSYCPGNYNINGNVLIY